MNSAQTRKGPPGVSLLVGFFCFGAAMCSLTVVLLLFPGSPLDLVWRVKPTAKSELAALGVVTIPLMMIVGAACASAAIGLARRANWGRRIAVAVLVVNIIGDSANAVLHADGSTLIGLPIGSLLIFYLMRPRTRHWFAGPKLLVSSNR